MAYRLRCFLCFTVVIIALSAASLAQIGVGIMVSFGPPPLPVYEQPLCPGEGYIWTPGYWAWDGDFDDYYWVPGTWVLAPTVGFLWTPGWWGWGGEGFYWHEGYWGPQVGFYGGINYGYGYFGRGYEGGRWDNGRFFYNRSVNNVNVTNIHNVYNTTVINNTTVNRVSYNGGNGGIPAQPTSQEQAADRERHMAPVAAQNQHLQAARANPQLRAAANQGKPPIAATPKPAALQDSAVVPARQAGGPYTPPVNRAGNQPKGNPQGARPENNSATPSTAVHPKDLPRMSRPPAVNSGNAEQDKSYQQQQEQLHAQQQQERQKLQQQQEQEHQQMGQQEANKEKQQQLEQKHQQQTQQLQQQHAQQQQQLAHQQQQHPQQAKQQPRTNPEQPPKQ